LFIELQTYDRRLSEILDKKEKALSERKSIIPFNKSKGMYLVVVESDKGRETYKILN
jgi:hypothetical protein